MSVSDTGCNQVLDCWGLMYEPYCRELPLGSLTGATKLLDGMIVMHTTSCVQKTSDNKWL